MLRSIEGKHKKIGLDHFEYQFGVGEMESRFRKHGFAGQKGRGDLGGHT